MDGADTGTGARQSTIRSQYYVQVMQSCAHPAVIPHAQLMLACMQGATLKVQIFVSTTQVLRES